MSDLLKKVSDFLAHHKGLPVLVGVGLVFINMMLNLLPSWPVIIWLTETDILLNVGVILGLLGILIGDAL